MAEFPCSSGYFRSYIKQTKFHQWCFILSFHPFVFAFLSRHDWGWGFWWSMPEALYQMWCCCTFLSSPCLPVFEKMEHILQHKRRSELKGDYLERYWTIIIDLMTERWTSKFSLIDTAGTLDEMQIVIFLRRNAECYFSPAAVSSSWTDLDLWYSTLCNDQVKNDTNLKN